MSNLYPIPYTLYPKSGFTLIELLVVITIISLLAAIGLAVFSGTQAKGRDSIRKSDLNQLAVALEGYLLKNNSYVPGNGAGCATGPGTDTDAFYSAVAPYVKGTVPKDPSTNMPYCYISVNNGKSYRLFSKLENCQDSSIINPATCLSASFNYSRVSPDLTITPSP